jgi:hypothetical protein
MRVRGHRRNADVTRSPNNRRRGKNDIDDRALHAEIAAETERLMRAADKQVDVINEQLYERPTTTGVRYHRDGSLFHRHACQF